MNYAQINVLTTYYNNLASLIYNEAFNRFYSRSGMIERSDEFVLKSYLSFVQLPMWKSLLIQYNRIITQRTVEITSNNIISKFSWVSNFFLGLYLNPVIWEFGVSLKQLSQCSRHLKSLRQGFNYCKFRKAEF